MAPGHCHRPGAGTEVKRDRILGLVESELALSPQLCTLAGSSSAHLPFLCRDAAPPRAGGRWRGETGAQCLSLNGALRSPLKGPAVPELGWKLGEEPFWGL